MINAWTFAPGDKVMQIENDYDKEFYNGDVEPHTGELPLASTAVPSPSSLSEWSNWSFGLHGCRLSWLVICGAA